MKPHTPITNAQETMNFLSCYALVGEDWLSDIFELRVIYNFDQDYNLKISRLQYIYGWNG